MPDELTFREAIDSVRAFHERVGAPVATKPCVLPSRPGEARFAALELITLARRLRERSEGNLDLLTSRVAFALEELADWAAAHDEQSLVAAADAIGDRLFLLLGDAVATGMPLAAIFERVLVSNLTKTPGVTSGVGKAFKGPGYQPPVLADLFTPPTPGDQA